MAAKKSNFADVANRLAGIQESTLDSLIEWMTEGPVTVQTKEERQYFKLIGDLDFIGAHVDGSVSCTLGVQEDEGLSACRYEPAAEGT